MEELGGKGRRHHEGLELFELVTEFKSNWRNYGHYNCAQLEELVSISVP
jgi:hypothetical protein